MNIEKYALKLESSRTIFEFESRGLKGRIAKIIQFEETNEPGVYNLAFGDKDPETGMIDDLSVSNNGDSEKVLATVISALYLFFDLYPDAFVYATGSTYARTRLYRMGITRYFEQVRKDFYLYGESEGDFGEFEIGKDYRGFLVERKF